MGLVSNGGVHSSQEHLHALCKMAVDYNLQNAFIHAFTDGRDCDPKSGLHFIQTFESEIENTPVQIASVIGRYFAMDRDNRWGRIKKAYDLMVHRTGENLKVLQMRLNHLMQMISQMNSLNQCDQITGERSGAIEEGDIVISFNFRTDRPREISIALTQKDFEAEKMQKLESRVLHNDELRPNFRKCECDFRERQSFKHTGRSAFRCMDYLKFELLKRKNTHT